MTPCWLEVHRGGSPVVIALPHTGTTIDASVAGGLKSEWLARRDADWWIDKLYAFARDLDVTFVRTAISRSVIDVNRDPSGASLYPGMATTELCPTTSFDGEALYRDCRAPDAGEVARRTRIWFEPYHRAISDETARLRERHAAVVLYDAHSIRSNISRLFDGELPQFSIGTNSGKACDPALAQAVEDVCRASAFSVVRDGRFKGGWTTRHHGRPETGVHAIQMELACRGYMDEPDLAPAPENWPAPFVAARAAPLRAVLREVIDACLSFARAPRTTP